jgi:electron transfer flavoprotein beta subunit
MANMRTLMPALQKARPAPVGQGCAYSNVALPKQQRETRIVKDKTPAEIARELAEWVGK